MITLLIIIIYLAITLLIGYYASRKMDMSLKDLFVANRSLGIISLAMATFGSVVTSFGILGGPGIAYKIGYSALGYMVGIAGFANAMGFYLVGLRAWSLTEKYDYVTSVEFFKDRFRGNLVRYVVAFLLIFLMIPYLLIMGIGSGAILSTITGGLIPYWLGALVILIICTYIAYSGGMRGTAWTNIFQGAIMFIVLITLLYIVYNYLGGGKEITKNLTEKMVSRAGTGMLKLGNWVPYSLIVTGIGAGVQPHVLIRNMSASSSRTIKRNLILFPILISLFWVIAILLGVWGKVAIPDLGPQQAENIVPLLAERIAPVWMVGFLGAGILSAIMSSWDGMILAISSLFTEDIIKPIYNERGKHFSNKQESNLSRYFIIFISIVVYVLVLIRPATILSIATFSFSGIACFIPTYIGVLYFKKTTKWGVLTSVLVSVIFTVLWAFNILPGWTTFGMHYSAPAFILSSVILIGVSLITKSEPKEYVDEFYSAFTGVYTE